MTTDSASTRELSLIEFHTQPFAEINGARRWLARTQNVFIEWVEAAQDGALIEFEDVHESVLLVFGASAEISSGACRAQASPRSVCIIPPGSSSVRLAGGGACVILSGQRIDLAGRRALNESHFLEHDARIHPCTPAYRRRDEHDKISVIPIDSFDPPADNPRLKMLQSSTISINWVEYDGPRDRRALSPHSHAGLEQASLGVTGHFVHHLREPWGRNADQWRDDRHLEVAPPSLMVVPINLIHTSEGVRNESHLLIDIFSPPRRDFIAKGWVNNAFDYDAPDQP